MWQEERRQRIRSMLATFGNISVDRVTGELGVSRETVRRDLLELEQEGALKRVRGGAVPAESPHEAPYAIRSTVRLREKQAIAGVAASLVQPGQVLFLDGGSSTTAILAERLSQLSGLVVITNSVDVATRLGAPDSLDQRRNRVVLIGGDFSANAAATFGPAAINDIHRHTADMAFLSPFGLDAAAGATSYDPDEAEIARAMFARARRRVLMADHSKLGTVSRVSYAALSGVDQIVVDARAVQSDGLPAIRAACPQVLVAPRG